MKIGGRKIEGPNEVYIVIPRPDEDIAFTARSVIDFEEVNKILPEPRAPMVRRRGSLESTPDTTDRSYREQVEEYNKMRHAYLVLKSLEATPKLEWETVDFDNPDTWLNYEQELRDSGFSSVEIGIIIRGVHQANSLDEDMLKQARERFLASKQFHQVPTSPIPEGVNQTSQSSELVSASESNHRA